MFLLKKLLLRIWSLIQAILTLARFDLFLQGTLLILTLYDGYAYLLLRRSGEAGVLSRSAEDWVYIGASSCELLLGAFLGWFGRKRRQYALSSWLFVASVSGLLVLAFPQPGVEVAGVELCGGTSIQPSSPILTDSSPNTLRTMLIITTAVLCALARVSVWAHGITYLDDHEPENGAYFYGILVSIRISVGINARSWFESHSSSEDWWKGQLSFAMLTLMFSVLFTLFPTRMPSWNYDEEPKNDGFLETMLRLIRNKVLIIQTVALSLLMAGVWGFVYHEADYVRVRYNFESAPDWSDSSSTRLAGDILRTFVIVFLVAVFRARFSGRRKDGIKTTTASKVGGVVAVIATAFFLVLTFLKCDTGPFTGLGDSYAQPECSGSCGCESTRYGFAPVCVLGEKATYFSPCHAGCQEFEDLNGFYVLNNCTCVSEGGRATQGACNTGSCQTYFAFYQVAYVNAMALSATSILMQGMALLRSVAWYDKPTAVGATFGVVALLANVLGHLLYMIISDATCAFKHEDTCYFHNQQFPSILAGVSSALVFLSAILSLAAFWIRRSYDKAAAALKL